MKKRINVALPLNISPGDLDGFSQASSYKLPPPVIRYIRSAFVTSTGLVCASRGLVKECCHYEWEGQPEVCLAKVSQFYKDATEDPRNLLVFDDHETYLVIHHPWHANYYHWLNESIYRLWLIRDKVEKMVLLLPSQDKLSAIAMDSLKPFRFKKIVFIADGKSAFVRTLCMPAQKPGLECFNPNALRDINKIYLNYITRTNTKTCDRIYVSRKNSLRRKIVNEDAVIKTLLKYNFTIVYSENHSFFEQVSLFSGARHLVGNHGAGLTNMLFMPSGSTIFELVKRKTNPVRHFNSLFWYMADALGHKYYHQVCEPIDSNELFYTADTIVDIDLLNKNLELIFMS